MHILGRSSRLLQGAAIGAAAILAAAGPVQAGGRLEQTVYTGEQTFPGFDDLEVVPIFWDDRCTSIVYTLDNIPATGATGPISPSTLRGELQTAFDQWNNIRTSYIEMNIGEIRTLGNGTRRFDFINELTWETPPGAGFLASSPSVSFVVDVDLAPGDDIDGDGDSDVYDPAVEGRDTCFDADGDGDIEFSAGFYKAGTILENDVQFNDFAFNPTTFPIAWETSPGSTLSGQPRAADVQAIAVHEFGHSHSLSHSVINQISDEDGTGSTMFPFIDIDDGAAEAGGRTLHVDDIAWSSFVYPEGTASSGPAALQPGDIPFSLIFKVIKGTLTQNGVGVLGGNILATSKLRGETVGEAYSGFVRVYERASDGACCFTSDPETDVIDGDWEMPVPFGLYDLHIQALDGDPVATGNISFTAQIGGVFGQHNFAEEYRGPPGLEDDLEIEPSLSIPVVATHFTPSVNIVTNTDIPMRHAGAVAFIGTGAAIGVADVRYAERFPNADVLALLQSGATLTTGLYRTGVFDASTVGVFKRAALFTGKLNPDGTANINLSKPLQSTANFVGKDGDLTPFFFARPVQLSREIEKALKKDPTLDLFLVLEAKNNPVVGDSGLPPLLGLDAGPGVGHSYLSVAGGPFNQRTSGNWVVELRFTPSLH